METLSLTGLGSTLRGTELIKRYDGDTDTDGLRHGNGHYTFANKFFEYTGGFVRGAKHGAGRLSMAGWLVVVNKHSPDVEYP